MILERILYAIVDYNEARIERNIKRIYDKDDTQLQKAKKLLNFLLTSNDKQTIASIGFYYRVLSNNNKDYIDHTKIDFKQYYKLFKRSVLEDNEWFYSHRAETFQFLREKNNKKLIEALLKDVRTDALFKEKLFIYFKWLWLLPYNNRKDINELLVTVEEGVDISDEKKLKKSVIKKLFEMEEEDKNYRVKNEKYLIKLVYKDLKNNEIMMHEFTEKINKIIKKSSYAESHKRIIASYTSTLIINEIQNQNTKKAKNILYTYIDLLPLLGLDEKSTDVASNGLVLAINSKDDEMANRIFNTVLGDGFDVSKLKNELLLFNLACYYASKHEKKKMLEAVRYALLNGKSSQEFLDDGDFDSYLNDEDFIEVLSVFK